MTPKEYLSQIERLSTLIDQRISERNDLRQRIMSRGAIDYSKPAVQSSAKPEASFARPVEALVEKVNEINRLVEQFTEQRDKVIGQIQGLDNTLYIKILYARYVEFKRLEVISVEMNYNYNYVRQLHGRALLAFGEKFASEIKF